MKFFEEESAAPAVVHRSGDGYCPVCQQYGKVVLRVCLSDPETNANMDVCFKLVCLYCNKKKGRLLRLFTWDGGKPDFSCKYVKLPKGISFEALSKAVENEPLQNYFTLGEVRQYQR